MRSFGKALKKWREDRGLTQEGLAQLLGATRKAVWTWEVGKRLPYGPKAERLEEIGFRVNWSGEARLQIRSAIQILEAVAQ